jgi:hypothetical protein
MIFAPLVMTPAEMRVIFEGEPSFTIAAANVDAEVGGIYRPAVRCWAKTSVLADYAADTYGDIWSRVRGRWKKLTATKSSSGYLTVTPIVHGKRTTCTVHRLVCEAYHGPPPFTRAQVRHLDGNSEHNYPSNLDWGTQSQNWGDRRAHGGGMGTDHHSSKLTPTEVNTIRASSESHRALSARYGVAPSTIYEVKHGKTWLHRQAPPPNQPRWVSPLMIEVAEVAETDAATLITYRRVW